MLYCMSHQTPQANMSNMPAEPYENHFRNFHPTAHTPDAALCAKHWTKMTITGLIKVISGKFFWSTDVGMKVTGHHTQPDKGGQRLSVSLTQKSANKCSNAILPLGSEYLPLSQSTSFVSSAHMVHKKCACQPAFCPRPECQGINQQSAGIIFVGRVYGKVNLGVSSFRSGCSS
jgi:hypothetical protein